MRSKVATRLLIISDTHGQDFNSSNRPLQCADVAIHCGDLTDGSSLSEFRTTIELLKKIRAPLKLVIAGNHDYSLDNPAFKHKITKAWPPLDPKLVIKVFGHPTEASELFDEAKNAGIRFLDEGTHAFTLENGAMLSVYASPHTPSFGTWGFQYPPEKGHDFSIARGVDVAITHGPPKGIMDLTRHRERAGCPDLFAAIARARPQIHCFGHIHEAWGAKLVTWRNNHSSDQPPTHFSAIDNGKSQLIETLAGLRPSKHDTEEDVERRSKKLERYAQERCCATSHCDGDEFPLERGKQTLFVNAAIYNGGKLGQRPWLVDVELPRACQK